MVTRWNVRANFKEAHAVQAAAVFMKMGDYEEGAPCLWLQHALYLADREALRVMNSRLWEASTSAPTRDRPASTS